MADAVAKEHRTASRVTTILEIAAAHPDGATLGDFSAALAAPKSSVHGLTQGLVATGYLRQEDRRYVLGPAIAALLATGGPSLSRAAGPAMRTLREHFDETVMLGTLVGDSVVYVDAMESTQLIRYSAPLHQRRPLYPTSTGKCFLAQMSQRRRSAYVSVHVPTADRDRVERELDEIRAAGFATNVGETLPDISAVASPIMVRGRPAACIAVAGPTPRMADKLTPAATAVLDAARLAALQLGDS